MSAGSRLLTIRHRIDVLDRFSKKSYRVPLQVEVRARGEQTDDTQVAVRWFELISTRQQVRVVSNGVVLGPLQAFAPAKPVLAGDPPDVDDRHVQRLNLNAVTGRDVSTIAPPHAITGEDNPSDGGLRIHVSIDGAVRGIDVDRHECHRLEEVVEEMRTAASGIFHRENEGWFVPKGLPAWIVSRNYSGPEAWRIEIRVPSVEKDLERIFGLEKLEAACEFCRWMNQGVDGIVVGRILELGSMIPEKDAVPYLALAAAEHTRRLNLKVQDLSASLIRDWHDVTNAEAVLADEGRSGAARLLSGYVRLADHLSRVGRDVGDWAPLLWRIEREGLVCKPSSADPSP